jgi:CDP-2,3-bis-(O-geranylgeranyl)-sn-glycerol synthase
VENIIKILIESVYFMLPAYAANALPVVFNRFNLFSYLAKPVDFNTRLFGKPLFGHSKTFRGFIVGVGGGIIFGVIQYFLYSISSIQNISLIDYSLINSFYIGFLLGLGALFGDLIKSFLKRRIGISSGNSWLIFDQIDYAIGALIFVSFLIIPSYQHIITIIAVSAVFSVFANIFAYLFGIKKVWW